ncbi:MAG: hypothetical protein JJU01_10120 [Alkalibacterium sp.]|nr:hypothetical protein [Alkalibacterium sp.]
MTKYTKLVSLIAFGVLTLSGYTFYQQTTQAEKLSVELVSEEGEPDTLDNLYFVGQVINMSANFNRGQTFEYSEGNITFIDNLPFLERVDYHFTRNMNRYTDDYRSFMRGKSRQPSNFAETEEHLVYTGMKSDVNWRVFNDNNLTISVLDKETTEEQDYEVVLNGGSNQSVTSTYVNYPSLTVVTQVLDDNILNNWFIYEFNLEEPQEELEPAVNFGSEFNTEHISFASNEDKTARFIPFRTMNVASTDEYGHADLIPGDYYAYDTQSGEIKAAPETDEDDENEYIVLSEENTLLIGRDLGDSIEWSRWDFDEESLSDIGASEMDTPTIGRGRVHYYDSLFNQGLQLIDGHLYAFEEGYSDDVSRSMNDDDYQNLDDVYHERMSRPQFQVIDMDTIDTVFSGYFTHGQEDESSNINLTLFDYGYSKFSN